MTQSKVRPRANLTDFYREEFLKHQRCLEQQREYYSDSAITPVEAALTRIISQIEQSLNQRRRRPGCQPASAEVQRGDRAVGLDRSEERSLRFRLPSLSSFRHHFLTIARGAIEAASPHHLIDRAVQDPEIASRLDGRLCASSLSAKPRPSWPTRLRRLPAIAFATASSSARIYRSSCRTMLEWIPSSHPLPDERSVAAGRRALDVARRTDPSETLVVLLSGGASALMAVPAAELTLEDKRTAVNALLKGGADITALNTIRKHLSAVKGGRLAAAPPGRRSVSRYRMSSATISASSGRGRRCPTRRPIATRGPTSIAWASRAC